MKNRLPDKPSALLALALKDLEKTERSKKYKIDMDIYHSPDRDKCSVCLTGAIMAQTLKVPSDVHITPDNYAFVNSDTQKKLYAINMFRLGMVREPVDAMGLPYNGLSSRSILPYECGPKQFKAGIRQLIKDLKAAKL